MATPSLFDRVVQALFGGTSGGPQDQLDRLLVADLIETIVEAVEPRVRAHPRYREKLERCVFATITHLRTLGKTLAEPLLLTRKAWSDDPRVNAFFVRPDDVSACLGRSQELRAFFDAPGNASLAEAYALMGMRRVEQTILAPKLEGSTVHHDVAQTTVSFTDHRIVAPSGTELDARREVGVRVFRRLAQVALSRIIELDNKATELQQRKGYLAARLRVLNLARDGAQGIVEDPASIDGQVAALEKEIKGTVDDYLDAKRSATTLDGYIEQIDAVFSHPEEHVTLTHTPLRLSRMGIKLDEASSDSANALVLAELSIGENLRAAIALVRCPRAELPPKEDLVAQAERYL